MRAMQRNQHRVAQDSAWGTSIPATGTRGADPIAAHRSATRSCMGLRCWIGCIHTMKEGPHIV